MTNLNTGGTKYPTKRAKIEKLHKEGFLDLLILHPGKNHNRKLLRSSSRDDSNIMYEVIIATTDPHAVERAVQQYMGKNQVLESEYLITLSISRFKDRTLCTNYPTSVRVAFVLGVPFNYKEILSLIPKSHTGSHYLSTPYNNGLYPLTNTWFEIPEELKDNRMHALNAIRSEPQPKYGEMHVDRIRKYDTNLLHTLLDSGTQLNTHIGAQFLDHTHLDLDSISRDYSVCIKSIDSLNYNNPIIPKATAVGVDCLPLRECIQYADLVEMSDLVDTDVQPLRLRMPTYPNSSNTPRYTQRPEYTMLARVAKCSGRFTYYKTSLDNFLIALQTTQDPHMSPAALDYLCSNLLVQKIRISVNENKENIGE